jgi:NADPH:quinone reductase-like Zn-dependent oxidoreductase
MKAYFRYKYGGPEVLQLEELEKPNVGTDEILVQIKATSLNPADWHRMRATPFFIRLAEPGLFKPAKRNRRIGADFSGTIESIGKNITDYKIGDEVFGEASTGSFSEYNSVKEYMIAKKPSNATFEESACLGVAGLTALQGIRDHGKVKAGERILINGASGGVGHYCVQIAKAMGAEVTAVCSSKNYEMMKDLGADHIIDYNETSIHELQKHYDLVVDVHGNMKYRDYQRLAKRGVMIGFTKMGRLLATLLRKALGKYPLTQFTAKVNHEDLNTLSQLFEEGKIKSEIEKTFPFEKLPEALGYIEQMHTSGKVAVTI